MAVQRIYFLQAQEHLVGISSINEWCYDGVGGGEQWGGWRGEFDLEPMLSSTEAHAAIGHLNCFLNAEH
jgi:hypothetical protein